MQTLLDYIEGGQPLDEFLADFPSVTRDHAIAVLMTRELKTLSILELRGLGKELWEGIDPVEYVRTERDSWDS